jgi:hypothetical protein
MKKEALAMMIANISEESGCLYLRSIKRRKRRRTVVIRKFKYPNRIG